MRRREFITLLGGAAAWCPFAAHGQQSGKVSRIAIVHPSDPIERLSETTSPRYYRPFFEELRGLGYVEGQNLVVDRYSGAGQTDRYAELARTVAASKPDVIFAIAARLVTVFKPVTATIPIVAFTSDPVAFGLVSSLAHPGGNITGVVVDAGVEFSAKRLELLQQAVPTASRIAYLAPRANWETPITAPVKDAARRLGISLIPALLETPIQEPEYRRAFAVLAQDPPDALLVAEAVENYSHPRLIVDLAGHALLPTLCPDRDFVEQGGFMSYATDFPDLFRHAGNDIGQILKGANPGEIPFYQATHFELVVNLKTAQALGLTVPQSLLARADEVIE